MRHPHFLLLGSLLLAPVAHASGVFLKWDACHADGGVSVRSFACDANAGSELLVCSVVLDADMASVSGVEARIVGQSAGAALPAWWQFKNVGTCRQNAMTAEISPSGPVGGCPGAFGADASGGIGAYTIGWQSPGGIKLVLAAAVPPSATVALAAGQEYFLFALRISHAKTVGTGACSGCLEPMCLGVGYLALTSPLPDATREFAMSGFPSDQGHLVSWQNSSPGAVYGFQVDPPFGHLLDYAMTCDFATRARPSSWGAVKSLYR